MKIKVMIVSKSESSITRIRNFIQYDDISIVGESSTGTTALDLVDNLSPDIIIMTLGIMETDTLSMAERIILHRPRSYVVFLVEHMDISILQSAINIGAHNVAEFPKDPKEFTNYIKSVYNNENARINSLKEKQNLSWLSQVITVFGNKGSIGKTTVAVNLAVKLAEKHKKVAIVDFDLQFGDVHIFLDIDPRDTITELVQEAFDTDIDSVRSFMTVHSSGVHVLCCPRSPEYAETISADKIRTLLSLLRSYYDYVIIDTRSYFDDITMVALESSSSIIFVSGLDISMVKNSKLSLSLIDSLQLRDKVLLAVNKVGDTGSITISDLEKAIGYTVWSQIPSDNKLAITALNRGVPFVLSTPNSKLAQSIEQMAKKLMLGQNSSSEKDTNVPKDKFKERKKFKLIKPFSR